MTERLRFSIRRNDTVKVLTGKDRGKQGKVMQVLPAESVVVVEGLNTRTKNVRSRRQGEPGQRIEFFAPIHISNVMLICPKCGKPTRVAYRRHEHDGKVTKDRMCRKCQNPIPTNA